ncbi:MAG: universal stress protein [Jatrophihabitantaceae bacterium]
MASHRIIIGVDGSPGARTALNWAVDECRLRACTLLVVHALDTRDVRPVVSSRSGGGYDDPIDRLLNDLAAVASARQPGVPVTTMLSGKRPADALIGLSADAQLLVVGTRGRNGFAGTMLGSVSHRTAAHAQCAVAIIPLDHHPVEYGRHGVVVGASDGRAGRLALEFARHEADIRGTTLRVVRAEDDPVETLLDEAHAAQLLVLGCHHSADRWATRLGPVPTAILPRSPCPVIVVGAGHDTVDGTADGLTDCVAVPGALGELQPAKSIPQ